MKLLNEYGFFLILKGLGQYEFSKIKVITYRTVMADYGVVRCQICFADFVNGDRLKQFPKCNDLFHIRCLELWLNFEAKCPMCLIDFPGFEFSQTLNSTGGYSTMPSTLSLGNPSQVAPAGGPQQYQQVFVGG